MNYKTPRMNLANYKAPAVRPVFLEVPLHARVAHPWRATVLTALAGFVLAFVAAVILFTVI